MIAEQNEWATFKRSPIVNFENRPFMLRNNQYFLSNAWLRAYFFAVTTYKVLPLFRISSISLSLDPFQKGKSEAWFYYRFNMLLIDRLLY